MQFMYYRKFKIPIFLKEKYTASIIINVTFFTQMVSKSTKAVTKKSSIELVRIAPVLANRR